MDPNQQQPNNQSYGPPPQPGPQPASGGYSQQPQSYGQPSPQQPTQPAFNAAPPTQPVPGYGPQPDPTYAVDYLDQIAPPPPRPTFFSGMFGKIFFGLVAVFVLAVSLIIAFGNQRQTAELEKISVRSENLLFITDQKVNKDLKSGKLTALDSRFMIWLKNTKRDTTDMLALAGITKTKMDKDMVTKEKATREKLIKKFEDARLNAKLDRVYASEMAYQAQLLKADLDKMAKKGPGPKLKEFAAKASKNLDPIQKSFAEFSDSAE